MITYIATNTTNGRFYIGSTNSLERRKREHLKNSSNYPFQNALRKNPEAFEWQIFTDESEDRELEQALLDMFCNTQQCYNINSVARCPPLPTTGRTWWTNSAEIKEKTSLECPGEGWVLGRLQTSTTNAHLSSRGREMGEEMKQNLSQKNKGKKRDEKTKRKMKLSWKGKRWWVNSFGESQRAVDKPGPDWKEGRKWK